MINRVIYQFWCGNNTLTPNRINALKGSKENIKEKFILVTSDNLNSYILKDYPIHPAYQYLSLNHKSDYLRCYFMHLYGGGYADIKPMINENNWSEMFDLINSDNEIEIIGKDLSTYPIGAARPEWQNKETCKKLLGCCFFICRPKSNFTAIWFERVNKLLDTKLENLKQHPFTSGYAVNQQNYPLAWAELMGQIFHGLCIEQYDKNPKSICNKLNSGWNFERYR